MSPNIIVKQTPKNLSIKVLAPGDGSRKAIIDAILEITADRQLKMYQAELPNVEELEAKHQASKDEGSADVKHGELIIPSPKEVASKVHQTRMNAIRSTLPKLLLELEFDALAMVYIYLCGMENPVARTGHLVQGIANRINGESVFMSLFAEMNDISVEDAMASLTAGKKVKPGERATIRLKDLPDQVQGEITEGFVEKGPEQNAEGVSDESTQEACSPAGDDLTIGTVEGEE